MQKRKWSARECLKLPCCLSKTPPLLHLDKISRSHFTEILFIPKNQEFSSASFPHIFNAIRPLEKILETKNDFFLTFKKAGFSECRIYRSKTRKNQWFLTDFPNIDFIWGKPIFLNIGFLPLVSPIRIHAFYSKFCLSVLWWFWSFQFCQFSQ